MTVLYSVGVCAAAVILPNMALFAQATSQPQAAPSAAAQQTVGDQQGNCDRMHPA